MPQPEDMINPTFIKKIKQTFSRQGPLNWQIRPQTPVWYDFVPVL